MTLGLYASPPALACAWMRLGKQIIRAVDLQELLGKTIELAAFHLVDHVETIVLNFGIVRLDEQTNDYFGEL